MTSISSIIPPKNNQAPVLFTAQVQRLRRSRSVEDILEYLAELYDAKRTGHKKFAALCPSHPDRNPSLKFGLHNGVIVMRCHAGCDTAGVLAARGLTFRNLYLDGPPPTQAQRRQARMEQDTRERKKEAWNGLERAVAAHCRECWQLHHEVATRLIVAEEGKAGDDLAVLFHQTLDQLRANECECERLALHRRKIEALDRDYYARLHQLRMAKVVAA